MNKDLVYVLTNMSKSFQSAFVKKLAKNDISWSQPGGSHQAGIYIPAEQRDSGFFPALTPVTQSRSAHPNREAFFEIFWQDEEPPYEARIVHYVGKGEETHLTRLNKEIFSKLSPSSLFLMIKMQNSYHAYVVHMDDDDYEFVENFFEIPPDFVSKVCTGEFFLKKRPIENSFLITILDNYSKGLLGEYFSNLDKLPPAIDLAARARTLYLQQEGRKDLNPFEIEKIGDVIYYLSRDLEYKIFRALQEQLNCTELILKILGDGSEVKNTEQVITSFVEEFKSVDSMFLSASQQRKSRAGYSFEYHIESILIDGGIPFDKQIFEGSSKPDFIIPSYSVYQGGNHSESLVLSAKTTLRERWRQVLKEGRGQKVYLATVDDKVSKETLVVLRDNNVCLVVPEAFKSQSQSKFNVYGDFENVITFDDFFKKEIPEYSFWKDRAK